MPVQFLLKRFPINFLENHLGRFLKIDFVEKLLEKSNWFSWKEKFNWTLGKGSSPLFVIESDSLFLKKLLII